MQVRQPDSWIRALIASPTKVPVCSRDSNAQPVYVQSITGLNTDHVTTVFAGLRASPVMLLSTRTRLFYCLGYILFAILCGVARMYDSYILFVIFVSNLIFSVHHFSHS